MCVMMGHVTVSSAMPAEDFKHAAMREFFECGSYLYRLWGIDSS